MARHASKSESVTKNQKETAARDFGATVFSIFRIVAYLFGDTPERMLAVLEGTGVERENLDNPRAEFNFSQQLRQFDNLHRLAGCDWVLQAIKLFNPSSHDNLGLAVVSAPTVRDGLIVINNYVRWRITRFQTHLSEDSHGATLVFVLSPGMTAAQSRAMEEILLFSALSFLDAQLPSLPESVRFMFRCAEPSYAPAMRKQLGNRFVFKSPHTGVFVPVEYLNARPLLSDPSLHAIALERLDQDARRIRSADGFRARVERLLNGAPNGRLQADLLAKNLGVSTRSLTRKLAEADTNLRELTDNELRGRANRYLETCNFSMAEISDRLGFADPTGFSRAVRRWKLKRGATATNLK